MIPRKLRVCSFMCYREEQTLEFTGLHMTSLTGDNGHGKSALLDAITWVLWGKARARRDDELITLGESEMWVELEFSLGSQVYRVWRQRSKRGRGQSDLHFYIWDDALGDWRLLDEGNLAQRQSQIIRTLRLDYETFVNSAFLLQGRADSFTVKTPTERKQILADILGLGRYDQYEERAKSAVLVRRERVIGIESELRSIDAELADRAVVEARLEEARRTVEDALTALRLAEAERTAARSSVQALRSQQHQLSDLQARSERDGRELADLRRQAEQAGARLQGLEATVAQRDEIEAGWRQLEQVRAAEAGWNDRLRRHSELQARVAGAQRAVDQARMALASERQRLEERSSELGKRAAEVEALRGTLAEVQALLAEADLHQAHREVLAVELRELGERAAGVRHEMERVKAEGQAVKERLELLNGADEATCPVCNQALSDEHRAHVAAQLSDELDRLAERYRASSGELKTVGERKTALEAEDRELARSLTSRTARQRQAAQIEAAIAESERAVLEKAALDERAVHIADRLSRQEYGDEARVELAALSAAMAETSYDSAAHSQVRNELERLHPFDARYVRQLLPALEGLSEAQDRVSLLSAQVARREQDLAESAAQRAALESALAGLPQLEASLKDAEARWFQAETASRRAQQQQGAAEQQLHAIDQLEARRAKLRADLDALNVEVSLYAELREAFGKKGIQAMIIESAIPEVETEANRLLHRMSDGRMNLRLETQREKVTGGVAETLEIIISDELGSRSYELYSGGEAFRANLALRIALSRLLARRAGAQLQTLVIDEGFGSQDTRGLDMVVETINSIKDDFELVIVISHIDELKDQFGARIDVVKNPGGSRVFIR